METLNIIPLRDQFHPFTSGLMATSMGVLFMLHAGSGKTRCPSVSSHNAPGNSPKFHFVVVVGGVPRIESMSGIMAIKSSRSEFPYPHGICSSRRYVATMSGWIVAALCLYITFPALQQRRIHTARKSSKNKFSQSSGTGSGN